MQRQGFAEAVERHPDLSIVSEGPESIRVRNGRLDTAFDVPAGAVERYSWDNLSRVLCGGEERVIAGMTRVVGYFSKIHNWNESKLGELSDRRVGDYAITE